MFDFSLQVPTENPKVYERCACVIRNMSGCIRTVKGINREILVETMDETKPPLVFWSFPVGPSGDFITALNRRVIR